jgi:hypothetical protein
MQFMPVSGFGSAPITGKAGPEHYRAKEGIFAADRDIALDDDLDAKYGISQR